MGIRENAFFPSTCVSKSLQYISTYKVRKEKVILNKTQVTKTNRGGKKILNPVHIPNNNGLAVMGHGYPKLLFQDICVEI